MILSWQNEQNSCGKGWVADMRGKEIESLGGVSPCKDCKERYRACSDRCQKYKDWKAELERIKANRRAYLNLPFSPIK